MKYILVLVLMVFSAQAFAAESVYTPVGVESCITLDSADFDEEFEIDYYEGICRGQGPYVVKISGGDLRYGVSLLYRGKEVSNLTRTSAFHDLGSDFVEWRYAVSESGEKSLKALIFRISAYEDQNVNLLHVVKLSKMKSCTVFVLRDQVNDNEIARKIADDIDSYECI